MSNYVKFFMVIIVVGLLWNVPLIAQNSDFAEIQNNINEFVKEQKVMKADDVVDFIQDNGTRGNPSPPAFGSEYSYSSSADRVSVAKLTTTKFVIAYRDGDDGKAIIGTVSGESVIAWGSPSSFNDLWTRNISVDAISETKFVIAFREYEPSEMNAYAILGGVSGNTITGWGTKSQFESDTYLGDEDELYFSVLALSTSRFVVAYRLINGNYTCRVEAATISGLNITWRANYNTFFGNCAKYISLTRLTDTRFVIALQSNWGEPDGKGCFFLWEFTGSTINELSYKSFSASNEYATHISVTAPTSTSLIVAYKDVANSNKGTVNYATISGNTITCDPANAIVFSNSTDLNYISVVSLSESRFIISFGNDDNCKAISGKYDGSISLSSETICYAYYNLYNSTAALSETKFVEIYDNRAKIGYLTLEYASSTVTQNTDNVFSGKSKAQIIGIEVEIEYELGSISLSQFDLNTNGTTSVADISNARIYYTGATNSFSETDQFGSTFSSPNGAFVISGTQSLYAGTNYFWLTYDITPGASLGNHVDAECTQITVNGSGETPTTTAPTGAREIDNHCTGNLTTAFVSSIGTYYIDDRVEVPSGEEFSIQPGVELIFTGHHKFVVNGRLLAQGTENDMITFTAQDTVNGWHGLRFAYADTNGQDSSKVEYCKFEYGNASYGTAVSGPDDEGGAVFFYRSSDVVVKNSIFENNKGYFGGAISCYQNSDATIENCHFAHNSTNYGGALRAVFSSHPTIKNVTVANNTGAGISAHNTGSMTVNNSICWDNSGDEIFLDDGGSASVTYSDIQGSWTGTGNINDDPLFVDAANGDYHLTAASPCIDTGDPASPLDPDGTRADMGAYYYTHVSCTNCISPTDNSEWITKNPTLKWEENIPAIGYKLSLGTDNPPTNILNEVDLGNVTSYEISSAFELSTPYFWKVIPYDASLEATNCPVWSFTTQTDVIDAGNAFDFGNTRQNDYLEIPYSENLNPDQFTVSLWAKVEGGQGSYRSAITSRGNSRTGYIIYASNSNKWDFWTGATSSWSIINGPDIVLDTWTHIAATFDGSTMKLYINGND
ncbi:MAG: right-handed parallel beta-helix repeat-containing protein, partial [Candidatus Cloacimonetes bacterium]|nr:right-handed parallel beta-helix repeat-containing protein [Candidatus Cloacimonadota bacterium]